MPKKAQILIIAINTVILLVGIEICFRIFENPIQNKEPKSQIDELSSILPIPNSEVTHKHLSELGEREIHWRINSLGFRGPEFNIDNSEIRVAVYGDSNISGLFSTYKDTFCAQLQSYLNKYSAGKKFRVINAGVEGFGPDQSFLRYLKERDTIKPDIVLLHLFAENDFGDIIRNRLFQVSDDQSLEMAPLSDKKDPALDNYYKSRESLFQKSAAVRVLGNWAYEKILKARNRERLLKLNYDKDTNMLLSGLFDEYKVYEENAPKVFSQFDDSYDLDMVIFPDLPSTVEKKKLMGLILDAFRRETTNHGETLYAMIQPSIYDLVHFYSFEQLKNYRKSGLADIFSDLANENRIPAHNLFPLFEKSKPEDLFFKQYDAHWNELGQSIAAKSMGQFILERYSF